MILGLAAMIVANAATFLGAREVVRRWGTGKGHLDVPLLLVIRIAFLSTAVLIAGTTGTLRPLWLGVGGLVALIILRPKLSRPIPPAWGTAWWIVAGAVALRLLLQVWFFVPANSDALSYHLTKIPEWVQAGGFTREMGIDTHAPFPAGFELVETWWTIFLHHDVLIEMAGVEFLVLAAASVFGLAKELGMSEKTSAWAALASALIPGWAVGAVTCLNDLPVATLVLTAMLLLLSRAPWPWLVMVAGLGIGIKATFAYALPGFALLWLLSRKEERLPRKLSILPCVLGAAVGTFWYLRNLIWFGSPIYPVGSRGLVAATGELKIQFGPSFTSGWKNLYVLAGQRVYDDQVAYGGLLHDISGWGAVVFALGALALWLFVREAPKAGRLLAAFVVSLVSVLFLVNHDNWFMRFVLFFPALPVLAAVWMSERAKPFLAMTVAGLAVQFLATCFPVEVPLARTRVLAMQGWRERRVGPLLGFDPPGEGAVLFRIVEPIHNRGEAYVLYGPGFERQVRYFRGTSLDDLRSALAESKARYVYFSKANPKEDALLAQALASGLLLPSTTRLNEVAAPSGDPR